MPSENRPFVFGSSYSASSGIIFALPFCYRHDRAVSGMANPKKKKFCLYRLPAHLSRHKTLANPNIFRIDNRTFVLYDSVVASQRPSLVISCAAPQLVHNLSTLLSTVSAKTVHMTGSPTRPQTMQPSRQPPCKSGLAGFKGLLPGGISEPHPIPSVAVTMPSYSIFGMDRKSPMGRESRICNLSSTGGFKVRALESDSTPARLIAAQP